MSESCWKFCDNASLPARNAAWLKQSRGSARPAKAPTDEPCWLGKSLRAILQSLVGIGMAIIGSYRHGSRAFVLSNLYHQIKILRCIELENGIWESLINSWARIRKHYHLFVKIIEILLLMNGPNHTWTINIKAYIWKGFSDFRKIMRYY